MRTRAACGRLQRLYDTGKYICTHRRYGHIDESFYRSFKDLPISYDFLEVKLIRKVTTDSSLRVPVNTVTLNFKV